jgi:hypothetical protein
MLPLGFSAGPLRSELVGLTLVIVEAVAAAANSSPSSV